MKNDANDAREAILTAAAQAAEHSRSAGSLTPAQVETLLWAYFRNVSLEDLERRDPVDVYGAARSHYRLAGNRPPGEAVVRVYTPTVDEHGWSASHSVVEVVVDDMPFLVDSVTMELSRQDRGIHLAVHPQMPVRRDPDGNLLELVPEHSAGHTGNGGSAVDRAAEAEQGVIRESWIHVEIDRESDPIQLERIEDDLRRVLGDVRRAVQDWRPMCDQALWLVDELGSPDHAPPVPQEDIDETRELLRWLADDNFTFLGYREYRLIDTEHGPGLRSVPESGLGILRTRPDLPNGGESHSFAGLPAEVRAKAMEKQLTILTKANSRATVHRPAYLDYIGVKVFDAAGEVVGERRFLGLFTSRAYTSSVRDIPVLRRKAEVVLERSGYPHNSHAGKTMTDILETYPRDTLFQVSADELLETARAILQLQERRRLRLFVHRDDYGRYLTCLVYLPRDRFSTHVRMRLQTLLREAYGATTVDWALRLSESVLARLHFTVRVANDAAIPEVDTVQLEQQLASATRTWSDDFSEALEESVGEEEAARLRAKYADAFPAAYREDFTARTAVSDLRRLEELGQRPDDTAANGKNAQAGENSALGLSLYQPVDAGPDEGRFKIYRRGSALSLSEVLPRLTQMGVEVVDERPYEIVLPDGEQSWVYDFGLVYRAEVGPVVDNARQQFSDAFAAVWSGQAESDGFNALVLYGGLTWRQVVILRAYAKYLRQAGVTFSQELLADVLGRNIELARLLVELFELRFDPDFSGEEEQRSEQLSETEKKLLARLDDVQSLDEDRIVRSFLALIRATLRTNYFQRDEQGEPKSYLSFKLEPTAIPDLPEPRPRYEIWVYSPRVEGVHLRFGAVARGGLRWSDRREDFRTEILGLVKAQMVKNAVIVPVGAKGGFYPKQLPDASNREAWMAEGVLAYRTFIAGMLDITDNLSRGDVLPPTRVVRHDGDDTYLVVAADKGTASFSDIANELAMSYGYWLGDAFASGGSEGYDHKAMGITARGAWESVKRHFREMGRDCQREDFTCVGVGDMSGDVFGNGMLLSEHTRLVAAFDHRHIFIDPDPDAATSYAERRRLFELPRSSWADYSRELISTGGGVFPRTAKSIELTPQIRAALGIEDSVRWMTPAELIRAVLSAPVDLLFNGGIGTYVKASTESNADVGDKANDVVRVNGDQLRAKCVGEGGNLGFTQLGRIEFAQNGGRINTDFIDNSAGVNTSDHEVNIKILLDQQVRDGDLTDKHRSQLLGEMTSELAGLVLAENYEANVALQISRSIGSAMFHVRASWLRRMERLGLIDRELEFLPSDKQLKDRQAAGEAFTAPELAVMQAYTKIALETQILDSELPDDPYLYEDLLSYFPSKMRERYAAQVTAHPLRRQIVSTLLVNKLVNIAGTTFYHRLSFETDASAAELARAHVVGRRIFGVDRVFDEVAGLDGVISAETQVAIRLVGRTIAERASRWLVQNQRGRLEMADTVAFYAEDLERLMNALPEILVGREHEAFEKRRSELLAEQVPEGLATRVAVLPAAYAGLNVVRTARKLDIDLLEAARVHFTLGERLELGQLLERILALPRRNQGQTKARAGLRDDLHAVQAKLTERILLRASEADSEGASAADQAETEDAAQLRTSALSVGSADSDTGRQRDAECLVEAWEASDSRIAKTRATLADIVEGEGTFDALYNGVQDVRRLLP